MVISTDDSDMFNLGRNDEVKLLTFGINIFLHYIKKPRNFVIYAVKVCFLGPLFLAGQFDPGQRFSLSG
jgi:hypothetical protein